MLVYQRVNLHFPMVFLWFSHENLHFQGRNRGSMPLQLQLSMKRFGPRCKGWKNPPPQGGAPVEGEWKTWKKWLNSMVYGRYNELVFMGFINQQTSLKKHHIGAEIWSCIVLHVSPFVLLRYLNFWPMFPHVSIIWVLAWSLYLSFDVRLRAYVA